MPPKARRPSNDDARARAFALEMLFTSERLVIAQGRAPCERENRRGMCEG